MYFYFISIVIRYYKYHSRHLITWHGDVNSSFQRLMVNITVFIFLFYIYQNKLPGTPTVGDRTEKLVCEIITNKQRLYVAIPSYETVISSIYLVYEQLLYVVYDSNDWYAKNVNPDNAYLIFILVSVVITILVGFGLYRTSFRF